MCTDRQKNRPDYKTLSWGGGGGGGVCVCDTFEHFQLQLGNSKGLTLRFGGFCLEKNWYVFTSRWFWFQFNITFRGSYWDRSQAFLTCGSWTHTQRWQPVIKCQTCKPLGHRGPYLRLNTAKPSSMGKHPDCNCFKDPETNLDILQMLQPPVTLAEPYFPYFQPRWPFEFTEAKDWGSYLI